MNGHRPARPPGGRLLPWTSLGVAVLLVAVAAAAIGYYRGRLSPSRPGPGSSFQAQVSDAGVSCTLPIATIAGAGLLEFPAGRLRVDGSVKLPPTKMLQAGPAYDAKLRRWLPGVRPEWISPDGTSYMQAAVTPSTTGRPQTSELYSVDVASGRRTRVWSGPGMAAVLGYATGGIYFTTGTFFTQVPEPGVGGSEVWVVKADRPGEAHRIGPSQALGPLRLPFGFDFLGGGAAWGVATPPSAPGLPSPLLPSLVLRMDLATGVVTTYFQDQPGQDLRLLGVDPEGEPVVAASDTGNDSPNVGFLNSLPRVSLIQTGGTRVLLSRPASPFAPTFMLADGHGIWFGGPGSVWLYTPARGIRPVARIPPQAFSVPTATPVLGGTVPSGRPTPSGDPFAGPSGRAALAQLGPTIAIAGTCT